MSKPLFTIKNKFQKSGLYYQNILTADILRTVCERLTGRDDYIVNFDNDGYNIGRLAKLEYNNSINYISFSEINIVSRNSPFQSFPSALVKYHLESNPNKKINFYFLKHKGNIKTPYAMFMYKLMKTAGTNFLNDNDYLTTKIKSFDSVSEIITQRDSNRSHNSGNKSSYVTIDENGILQIFGKTYGANKYETTLLCLAIHKITPYIQLYEIEEGDLKELPNDARHVIKSLGIDIITSDLVLEREIKEFEINDSLRSSTYISSLLEKIGRKKCALCNCEIPQIIQGAHIWPVANIKAMNINRDEKIQYAIDGDNGLWLCNNHHKLFDANILYITIDGQLKYKLKIEQNHREYLKYLTINTSLPDKILTPHFKEYLNKRNELLDEGQYSFVE